jgi:hypothetical protein
VRYRQPAPARHEQPGIPGEAEADPEARQLVRYARPGRVPAGPIGEPASDDKDWLRTLGQRSARRYR